jgi:hypothetical protein
LVTVFAFGAVGSAKAASTAPLMRWQDVELVIAYFVVLLGYGTIAFFFSFLTRSSGAAMASTLLYTIVIENIVSLAMGFSDSLSKFTKYLPTKVFDDLLNPLRYDSEKLAQATERIQKMRDELELIVRDMPSRAEQAEQFLRQMEQSLPAHDGALAYTLAFGYMIAICALIYLIFKKRDL